jgi:serine/threonine protein kinase
MHDLQLIHRDLKPSNILLDSDCHIKICDFGLVRSLVIAEQEHPILSEEVATRWYRAPELLLSSRTYSYPADMWSVGCIAAELLTGKPLFDGRILSMQATPHSNSLKRLSNILELYLKRTCNRWIPPLLSA